MPKQKEENFSIQFTGLNKTNIELKELKRLTEIASREADKIFREIKNQFNLLIHVKEYEITGGVKRKYSVNIKLRAPGQVFTGKSHKGIWTAKTALHKAFENIHNKIKTKFREDSSYRKEYE